MKKSLPIVASILLAGAIIGGSILYANFNKPQADYNAKVRTANDQIGAMDFNRDNSERYGYIEGSLSYPSEGLPDNLVACADNEEMLPFRHCTAERITDIRFTYGFGYRLLVPVGEYDVYAVLPSNDESFKGLYSDYVECTRVEEIDPSTCKSHEMIKVKVTPNETVRNVDLLDWYSN